MIDSTRRATLVAVLILAASAPAGAPAGAEAKAPAPAEAAAKAPAAAAAPVAVNLRIEGATRTYFEGPVATDGHNVTTASAGTRKCDGTNNGAHPTPGPTPIAALDDAARLNGFTWDGDWFDSFEDFLLSHIANEHTTPTTFWALYVNYASASVGGCQLRSAAGDEVLFAQAPFSSPPALRLEGPSAARTGEGVNVKVVDGATGQGQSAASVSGTPTGAEGVASLRFDQAGVYRLKAERPGAIRSNALVLCVDPAEADPCSSADKAAPSVRWRLPGRLASERGRSRTILLSWQGDDGAGSGVAYYGVEVRKMADGAGADAPAPEWRRLLDRVGVSGVHFRGEAGDTYQFRISAVDRAANRATVETDPVVIPVDDRDRRLWRFSKRWRRVRAEAAWGRTVTRAKRAGASARLAFRGTRVALIGHKLAKGGQLRVTVDGRARARTLRGRSSHRSVLWRSRRLAPGQHVLRVRSLGGGPVELDAVAPLP